MSADIKIMCDATVDELIDSIEGNRFVFSPPCGDLPDASAVTPC
jgi:ribosome-interacting GTPase 1